MVGGARRGRSSLVGRAAATLHESVWLSGHGEPLAAVRGDRVRVSGIAPGPQDAGFGEFLLRRGIAAELSAYRVERLGPSSNPLIRATQAVRAMIGRSIRSSFAPREAGLLLGLALGDDSGLDEGSSATSARPGWGICSWSRAGTSRWCSRRWSGWDSR